MFQTESTGRYDKSFDFIANDNTMRIVITMHGTENELLTFNFSFLHTISEITKPGKTM